MIKVTKLDLKVLGVSMAHYTEIVAKPKTFLSATEFVTVTLCHHMTRLVVSHVDWEIRYWPRLAEPFLLIARKG